MVKKITALCVCLIIAAAFVLSGCASSDPEHGTAQASGAETEVSGYLFAYNGMEIAMKAPAAPVLEKLGEAKSYTEETSCAFEGLDKSYFYGSFYLYTYPQGEEDFINMVELVDDTVKTEEGVSIGDSKEKVEKIYGAEGFNGVNAYVMNAGETSLTIILDHDKVSSIQYAAVFE